MLGNSPAAKTAMKRVGLKWPAREVHYALISCGTVVALLTAALVSPRAQAPSPQTPAVHKLAATLRDSGCSVAGIESGDPTKGPSIIVEKFAAGCAIPWHWHTPNEHVMMVSGIFRLRFRTRHRFKSTPEISYLFPRITPVRRLALDQTPASIFYILMRRQIYILSTKRVRKSRRSKHRRTMRKLTLNGDSGEPVLAWKVVEPHKYLVQSDLSDYPVYQDLPIIFRIADDSLGKTLAACIAPANWLM